MSIKNNAFAVSNDIEQWQKTNASLLQKDKLASFQASQIKKDAKISELQKFIILGTIALVFTITLIAVFLLINLSTKKEKESLEDKNYDLEKSNHKKEILLKEIHHRIKNNLQLVMSMLYIQSQDKNLNIKDFLEISQTRISSIALIHENLYKTKDLGKVNFKEYIHNLKNAILTSQQHPQKDIQLKINIEEVYFDIETAIPLGLIINELITNAYEHAFLHQKQGTIRLTLKQENEHVHKLQISDNGTGFAKAATAKNTLGLELVKQLVLQIDGSFTMQNVLGTHYNIQFKNNMAA